MKRAPAENPRAGFALVLVLWTLLLSAVLVNALMLEARTSKATAVDEVSLLQDRLLLDGAINRAIVALLDRRDPLKLPLDGTHRVIHLLGRDVEVSGQGEAGKIDVNIAPAGLLLDVFRYIGAPDPETVASEIVTWRDSLPTASRQDAIDRYRAAGRQYYPRFGPFRSVGELGLILGINDPLLRTARPFLTVWSGNGMIDRTLASDGMLRMLAESGDALAASQKRARDAGQAAGADRDIATGDVVTITASFNTTASKRSQTATIQIVGGRHVSYRILAWR